jgi:hypothetical protein
MRIMTFKEYVHSARLGQNYARSDFLRDAREDRGMPDNFKSLSELRAYLTYKHQACAGAIEGAEAAWRGYQKLTKRTASRSC